MLIKQFKKPVERLDEIDSETDSDKIFNKIMECTNKLLVNFNKRYICDKIIEMIDNSELVRFADSRHKLTSIKKPVFMLRIDLTTKCVEKYDDYAVSEYIKNHYNVKDLDEEYKKAIVDYKIRVVHEEVISPFSNLLMDEIKKMEKDNEEFRKLKEEIRKGLNEKDEEKLNRYIIPSIFTILVEKAEANVIKLEYIM